MKFIYFGDPHIRGTRPRNRLDDYKEAMKEKLNEIFAIAKSRNVTAIIQPGDTFHTPEVATSVLLEFADVLKKSPVPIYTTAGNHDIYGYNLDTFERTSLKVLELIIPQFHVINDPSKPILFKGEQGNDVQLTFTPYSARMDVDGYGYSPEVDTPGTFKIHCSHGMLLDHEPPFDRYTTISNVVTTANLVLCGHDHIGFGVYDRADGVTFANIGSLTRMDASQSEMKRTPQILMIDVLTSDEAKYEVLPLHCAKPGAEILDRSSIEAEQQRQYAMEEFAALIESETGDKVLVDIDSIVKTIAQAENISEDVVKLTLEKIKNARLGL